jgi:hypothetical protein
MAFLSNNKVLLAIVLVFVVGIGYYTLSSEDSSAPLTSSDQAPTESSQELLTVLANLETLQLNEEVFSDQVFLSLSDFGVTIAPEPVGRRNPFLPPTAAPSGGTAITLPGTR